MGDNFLVLLFTTKNTMGSKPSTAKPEGGSSSSSSSGGQVEFYWDPVSPPSRCVHMTLKALGEKLVAKHLDLFKGEHKTEEYLKINPAGKVPAIKCLTSRCRRAAPSP